MSRSASATARSRPPRSAPTDALENGGTGSICEQLLNDPRRRDARRRARRVSTKPPRPATGRARPLLEQAEARGFQVVETLDELQAVNGAERRAPLLGLFAPGNMPVRWEGPQATHHGNIDQPPVDLRAQRRARRRDPDAGADDDKGDRPALGATRRASSCRSRAPRSTSRTMPPIPAARSARRSTSTRRCRWRWTSPRPEGDTLVIVTADHAHASQIIGNEAKAPGLTAGAEDRGRRGDVGQLRQFRGRGRSRAIPAPSCASPPSARGPRTSPA